jgi:replicative superfamily II helicase
MVDFSKRLGKGDKGKTIDPVAIYETLDRASDKGPLRPAQVDILTQWHEKHRDQRDLVIKLHTGQGKTLIGLLLLQSKLNQNGEPAIYLCPNKFLVNQTCQQAKQFGVAHCTFRGDIPQEFLNGQQMLITHVQVLFNGQTQFKTGPRSTPVSTIVVDDAHACVDAIRDASVIKLAKNEQAYTDILDLFANALEQQGAGTLADIRNGQHDTILPVPYWAWQERHAEVVAILAKIAKYPVNLGEQPHSAWYSWPLIRDSIIHCQCVISGQSIEIAPYLPPLELFGSYSNAKHRVFMSATVTNDSFLVKGLRLSPETISSPLVFKKEKWSGEKMLLLPPLIDPAIDRDKVVNEFAKPVSGRHTGVVALTPSFRVAEYWEKCGATKATKDTIDSEIERLRQGNCERTLAVASRYDGIDLPDDACRILIFDSLPYASNLIDAYADNCRALSDITAIRTARTVEQGLGRSVRGEKDYCVIILVGPELIRMVRTAKTRRLLSDQTRAQIEIGLEIAEMAKSDGREGDPPIAAVVGLIRQCLKRDAAWKQFYRERMDEIKPTVATGEELTIFEQELQAETTAQAGNPRAAVKIIQKLIDDRIKEESEKGWYMQEMARYAFTYSKSESNLQQLEAHRKNRYLMRPATGMQIDKLEIITQKRNANIITWLQSFANYEELHLAIEDICGCLEFGVKADRFEDAFRELGCALGFASQRPEKEWKEGPDNLWAVRNGEYLLIECKSEVKLDRADINKTESGQMNNACAWFDRNYPGASATPFLIIPTKKISKAAGFNKEVLVLRKNGLDRFINNVKAFYSEFALLDLQCLSEQKVQHLIDTHHLRVEDIVRHLEKIIR